MCTELIARQLGVVITAPDGVALKNPLNVTDPVAWVGYANDDIRAEVEPWLQMALRDFCSKANASEVSFLTGNVVDS